MQRLGLVLRQPAARRHVATVHGHRRRMLAVYSSLLSSSTTMAAARPMFISRYWSAELLLPREVLLLAHQKLEHVLAREQRNEQENDCDDSCLGVEGGDREPQTNGNRQRLEQSGHLITPESREANPVLHTSTKTHKKVVRSLVE